ncbi:hypothetical protein DXG01_006985 [Tephrocybe rancida]|nr:hypothetical protein DXG01_006985 [Tephrocybe rancida]
MPPVIARSTWPALPRHVQTALHSARQEPNCHLQAIVKLVDLDESWKLHPDIIDLYISQFDAPVPTTFSLESPKSPIWAIHAIWSCLACHKPDHLIPALSAAWPKVWRWIDFLYRELVFVDRDFIMDKFAHVLAVGAEGIIAALLTYDSTAPTAASTEGIFGLAVLIYIDLGTRSRLQPPHQSDIPHRLIRISKALNILILSPSSNFNEVVEAVGFRKYQTVHAMFQPINTCIQRGQDYTKAFWCLVDVQTNLCSRNPTFYASLPAKTIMSHIYNALSYFTSIPPVSDTNPSRSSATQYCIQSLLLFLVRYSNKASRGHSCVIYLLRGGIISLLLKAMVGTKLTPTSIAAVMYLLDELQRFFVHRPVFQRLSQDPALKETIEDAGILARWEQFLKAVAYLQAARDKYNTVQPYHPVQCSNYKKV